MAPDAFRDTLWRRQGEVVAGSPVAASRHGPRRYARQRYHRRSRPRLRGPV